jgi:hypothetical protein
MTPWWLSPLFRSWCVGWSREEIGTSTAIYGIAIITWALLNVGAYWLPGELGFRWHPDLLMVAVLSFPLALFAGRQISRLIWPRMVTLADVKAAERLAARQHSRKSDEKAATRLGE